MSPSPDSDESAAQSRDHHRAPRWLVGYLRWVLAHRALVVTLLVLLSAVAAYSVSRGVLSTALANLFFAENPKYERHKAFSKRFANDEIIAVAFEEPALGEPQTFARLTKVANKLRALPWVRRVQSLADLQKISGDDEVLTIRPYAEIAAQGSKAAQRALRELRDHPLYRGAFVGRELKTTCVLIEPRVEPDRPVELWEGHLTQVKAIFGAEGFAPSRLHLAGGPTHLDQMIRSSRHNLLRLFPLVAIVLLTTVLLLYRALWPLWPTVATALIAVLWTMGFSVALDRHISVLISVVPAVMLVVAVSDNIHICSAYLLEIGEGRPKDEALLVASSEVGLACYYTSITTLLGFASLAFIPAPVIRQMAIVLAFGVSMALWISLTLTPILLSLLPAPKASEGADTTRSGLRQLLPRLVHGICEGSQRLSRAWPRTVVLLFTVAIGLCAWAITRIHVETDLSKRYPESAPLRVAEGFISARLAGANFIDLYVRHATPKAVLEPRVFAAVAQLQRELGKRSGVASTLSLVDLVRTVHQAVAPPALRRSPPASRQANAQYLELFASSGGSGADISRLIDFSRQTLRVSLRLNSYGVRRTAALAEEARRRAQELLGPGYEIELSGLSYLLGDWLDNVLRGQRQGLLFAFLTIALVIAFALRSAKTGLLAMIPNATPLIFLGGYLGLATPVVDSDTMMVAIIAIGIAVDDTIHFLTRLRFERQDHDREEALRRTFAFSGRAIVMTTLILAIGFLPLAAGDYFTVRMMGTLLPMTLVFAVAADLLFLPALVNLGVMRFTGSDDIKGETR